MKEQAEKLPPTLEYPREWCYRVITLHDNLNCEKSLAELLRARGIDPLCLTPKGASSGGKYRVFQICTVVKSREEMEDLGSAFAKIDGVKFVL